MFFNCIQQDSNQFWLEANYLKLDAEFADNDECESNYLEFNYLIMMNLQEEGGVSIRAQQKLINYYFLKLILFSIFKLF
jgi:hypothetical protein